jgi:hypothetical protein
MKASLLWLALFCSAIASHGQGPFSTDEALNQLYHKYDPVAKTAQWVCTKDQLSKGMHPGWPCLKEDTAVSVSVILTAQVPEGDATKTYLATSAEPSQAPGGYSCHACAPAIGAAVFVWQGQHWALESANAAIVFSGGWGRPPSVELVAVGPQKHGLLLSSSDEGQGFASSYKDLFIPLGESIAEVWGIEDESDDVGAIDPDDKANSPPPYSSSAKFKFLAVDNQTARPSGYYDIEVTFSGTFWRNYGHPVKPENWTKVYTFKNGKYRLSRRTALTEVRGLKPTSTR